MHVIYGQHQHNHVNTEMELPILVVLTLTSVIFPKPNTSKALKEYITIKSINFYQQNYQKTYLAVQLAQYKLYGRKRKCKQLQVIFAYMVLYIRFEDHFKPVSTCKIIGKPQLIHS
jgi:hypothetical protein